MFHYVSLHGSKFDTINGLGVTTPRQDQLSGDQLVNWSVCRMSLSGGKLRVDLMSGDLVAN